MLFGGRTAAYKYSASASDVSLYRPTHLILWHAIRDAWERGHTQFDFGRTDLDGAGLRSFKLTWGAREEILTYSVIGQHSASRSPSGPPWLMRTAIRRSPVAVARTLGQLLYKYTA